MECIKVSYNEEDFEKCPGPISIYEHNGCNLRVEERGPRGIA